MVGGSLWAGVSEIGCLCRLDEIQVQHLRQNHSKDISRFFDSEENSVGCACFSRLVGSLSDVENSGLFKGSEKISFLTATMVHKCSCPETPIFSIADSILEKSAAEAPNTNASEIGQKPKKFAQSQKMSASVFEISTCSFSTAAIYATVLAETESATACPREFAAAQASTAVLMYAHSKAAARAYGAPVGPPKKCSGHADGLSAPQQNIQALFTPAAEIQYVIPPRPMQRTHINRYTH